MCGAGSLYGGARVLNCAITPRVVSCSGTVSWAAVLGSSV